MKTLVACALLALVAAGAGRLGAPGWLAGGLAGIALFPLAELLAGGLDDLSAHAGPRVGTALRSVLGSTPLLVLGVLALRNGQPEIVKAAITGAVLTSVLLALGIGFLVGGARHGRQYFNREQAAMAATLLMITSVALGLPTLVGRLVPVRNAGPIEALSEFVAGVMLVLFALAVYHGVTSADDDISPLAVPRANPRHGMLRGALTFALATLGLVVLGDRFFATLPLIVAHLGISPMFVGIVAMPLAGTINLHLDGWEHAWRNRVDLTLAHALALSLRSALLVAPLLLFASLLLGRPMDLVFPHIELAALIAAAGITTLVAHDGQSNWLEGAMLIGVWGMLAAAFYWWPA